MSEIFKGKIKAIGQCEQGIVIQTSTHNYMIKAEHIKETERRDIDTVKFAMIKVEPLKNETQNNQD